VARLARIALHTHTSSACVHAAATQQQATERPRDRETERQRDRETETGRQGDREAEGCGLPIIAAHH